MIINCNEKSVKVYTILYVPDVMERGHATAVVPVTVLALRDLDPSCQINLYISNKL